MALRILLVEPSRPVVAALRRDLEERGCDVDAVSPAAAGRVPWGRYGAALVRGNAAASEAVAALRAADPLLPVVVLFIDRKEAEAQAYLPEADGTLVGPLTASAVGTVCAFAGKLREAWARSAELEARLAARGGRDLDFLKKLIFVEVKRSRRYGHPLSLALLAVDGFAALTPRLAARTRTGLLADLLGAVTASLRDIDLAVPFSRERILVMMPHTPAEGALRVARRLCARIRDHAGPVKVTASVGVASHGGHGTVSFGALARRAGEALARAQAAGGDRAEAAEPARKRDRISIG